MGDLNWVGQVALCRVVDNSKFSYGYIYIYIFFTVFDRERSIISVVIKKISINQTRANLASFYDLPIVKNTGSQKGKQQQQQGRPSRRSAVSANERISSNTDR